MVIRRTIAWTGGLCLILLAVVFASLTIGPANISIQDAFLAVLTAIHLPVWTADGIQWAPILQHELPHTTQIIVRTIRLPRILLGAMVGFALATAGTVMQGFFRNPMADPSIIGVSAGAAVGAVSYIVLPLSIPFGLPAAAFTGALIAAFGVYVIATEGGHTPVATLLLAGIAIQTFLGAVISYLLLQAGESLERAIFWLMGHLHASTWPKVQIALPFVGGLFVLHIVYARDLNVLLLGEDEAHSLGINVEQTKRILLAGSSLITAIAVAVSGIIGFVGLIVPHIMRLLVGPDHRILLPTSAVAGATFLVATDSLARMGASEIPVGIVTAALGAPFFLYLLVRQEVHSL